MAVQKRTCCLTRRPYRSPAATASPPAMEPIRTDHSARGCGGLQVRALVRTPDQAHERGRLGTKGLLEPHRD